MLQWVARSYSDTHLKLFQKWQQSTYSHQEGDCFDSRRMARTKDVYQWNRCTGCTLSKFSQYRNTMGSTTKTIQKSDTRRVPGKTTQCWSCLKATSTDTKYHALPANAWTRTIWPVNKRRKKNFSPLGDFHTKDHCNWKDLKRVVVFGMFCDHLGYLSNRIIWTNQILVQITWPCPPITTHDSLSPIFSNGTNMLFLECWRPSWLP